MAAHEDVSAVSDLSRASEMRRSGALAEGRISHPGRAGSPTRRKHKLFWSTVGPRAAKMDDKASQGFNRKFNSFNRLEVVAGAGFDRELKCAC